MQGPTLALQLVLPYVFQTPFKGEGIKKKKKKKTGIILIGFY